MYDNPKLVQESMNAVSLSTRRLAPIMDKATIGFTTMLTMGAGAELLGSKVAMQAIKSEGSLTLKVMGQQWNSLSKAVYNGINSLPTLTEVASSVTNPSTELIKNTLVTSIISGAVLEYLDVDTNCLSGTQLPQLGEVASAGLTIGGGGVKLVNKAFENVFGKNSSNENSSVDSTNTQKNEVSPEKAPKSPKIVEPSNVSSDSSTQTTTPKSPTKFETLKEE